MRRWGEQDSKRLREQLRKARKQGGLTQVELAKRLGAQQDFVSKYETGERRLDIVELFLIVEALDKDPIEFLKEWKRK